jgi:hypothetical protein
MGLINPPQAMIEEDPIFGVLSTHWTMSRQKDLFQCDQIGKNITIWILYPTSSKI